MTHEREPLDHEQELLAHFRAHGSGEPSAEMDARILAAASAAARETQQAQNNSSDNAGWTQRLHQWLFGSGRQRWSVAVAGLACVGIGVSLTWRTLEKTPETFDTVPPSVAMSPAAPAPAPMAAKRAAETESMARMAVPQERLKAEVVARPAQPAAMADEPMTSATAIAPMAELVIQSEPREALLRLLELRKANKQEEAQRLLEQLMADYPQLDIEAELEHLAKEPSAE
ncbi:hypothetical protein [Ectopseudomonas mendocina]|uniref:Anti-sigma factor n=1 Tax=Ectopseudomonas mendocina TaxID=300 RepID=A0ABD7RQ87_ECTME|nr:hypothetical protein [Pseudomonas mendocina]AEB58051.1 hypothetical protein MDS_2020 [Pseudomonas mendocina NK-01]TRO10028.1 hypothetical protein EQ829_22790 [Pseudomonas mendocina]TRO12096.1 hypothetical protein EQ836_22990 [Pseudomonas mendocina]